jgi:cytochrome P450
MVSQPQIQKQPVGIPGFPLLGNMPEFARNPIKFITRLQQEYGDVAAFSLMGSKSVLISNPEDIERVLQETGKRYSNGKPSGGALETVIGNGLVTSEGDFWKRQRKLVAPAFHHQSIKQYADQIVAYGQDMAKTWQNGTVRDIHQDMMTLTQRIIMKVLFDVDVLDNASEASKAFDAMMHAMGAEMKGPEAILPQFIPTPSRIHMREGVAYINDLLMEIVEQRRAEGTAKRDLLTMLMDARDDDGQPMSTEQLLDEIRTLYLAGHETTATTLSWAWLLLSRNPDVYGKLEAEIEQALHGRAPTADDVQQLPYCGAVVKEALRCYPVAWITRRVALEDVEIGGYEIAKGTAVYLSPWLLHHDARWFAEPDAFMPERWLKDKADLPPREAYIPFGGGPRICIGNGFAMMEMVLLLATLLQHAHISVPAEHNVELEIAGTLRPKGSLQATVTDRSR